MSSESGGLYEFGPFRLDVVERRLLRSGETVPLTPKVFDLLVMLVENAGRLLEKEQILKTLWRDSFVEEANLTVNISVLRKALGEASGGGTFIETVPKKGYRFVADIRKLAPLPLAAALEPIPAPVPARDTGRRWAWAVACLTVLAGAGYWSLRPAPAELRSIAVLPFRPLEGEGPESSYLGLGMADAVITRLSNIRAVRVRPTSAVIKYSGNSFDPLVAGRNLQVDALLEGRIQQADGGIRVTVQLLRVRDGAPLWAEKFDDAFTNIFEVQDSISEKIAAALSLRLSGPEQQALTRRHTSNIEAYELYLQGQYLASRRTPVATQNAIRHFQSAIEKDPEYALAYAALAAAYITQAGGEALGAAEFSNDLRENARAAALKALSLDDQLADAHLSLGQILMRADWDWDGARRAFDRALAIDPNSAAAHGARAILLTAFAKHEEAIGEMEASCRLDPVSPGLRSDLGWVLYCARRYDEAMEQSRKAVEMDPWSITALRQQAREYLMKSMHVEAIDTLQRAIGIAGDRYYGGLAYLALAYARAGRRADAEAIRVKLEQRSREEPVSPYLKAVLYIGLGSRDSAFRELEEACDRRLSRVVWIGVEPELDPLRGDPRFARLLARMGLPR